MVTTASPAEIEDTEAAIKIWQALGQVADPEIPVVSVVDLGIVRDVRVEGGKVEVVITPTYTGCPATHVIADEVARAVREAGYPDARIATALSPPWTTDWISEEGRRKLEDYGIAPPARATGKRGLLGEVPEIACPRCGSTEVTKVSEFGSTACKAFYKCNLCLEPFDYFKCI